MLAGQKVHKRYQAGVHFGNARPGLRTGRHRRWRRGKESPVRPRPRDRERTTSGIVCARVAGFSPRYLTRGRARRARPLDTWWTPSAVLSDSDHMTMCTSSGLTLTCRVQYVDDIEPFPLGGMATAVPTRAPLHSFSRQLPLGEQLAAVARVLRAPHRVGIYCLLY